MRGFHISQIKNILPCPIRLPRCIEAEGMVSTSGCLIGKTIGKFSKSPLCLNIKRSPWPVLLVDIFKQVQWRIFRVFKVFSEHLKMKKKI